MLIVLHDSHLVCYAKLKQAYASSETTNHLQTACQTCTSATHLHILPP